MRIKKIAALMLSTALAAAVFTGCSKSYESVVTVGGTPIKPGYYLNNQYSAYVSAQSMVEEGANVLKSTIEDMPAEEWIHKQTIKNIQLMVWLDKETEARGLAFTAEEEANIISNAEFYWQYVEKTYTDNGIGYETYKDMALNGYKQDLLFQELYGEGKEKAITNQEASDYLDQNYLKIKGFSLLKTNSDGTKVSDENIANMQAMAQEAVDALNNGEDFISVQTKYLTLAGALTGTETDYSQTPENYTTTRFISQTTEDYSAEFIQQIKETEKGGKFYISETDREILICQRIENYSDETELVSLKTNILSEMMGEEFQAYCLAESEKLEVVEDAAAVKYYSPFKIKDE